MGCQVLFKLSKSISKQANSYVVNSVCSIDLETDETSLSDTPDYIIDQDFVNSDSQTADYVNKLIFAKTLNANNPYLTLKTIIELQQRDEFCSQKRDRIGQNNTKNQTKYYLQNNVLFYRESDHVSKLV